MPTQRYGLYFGVGVSGYLVGTLGTRRALGRWPLARLLGWGTTLTGVAGVALMASERRGQAGVGVLLSALFLVMFAHGINQPGAQAGALGAFQTRIGAAAGLLGCLTMLLALVLGGVLGWLHDGTLRPLATLAALSGVLTALSGRFPAHRARHAG